MDWSRGWGWIVSAVLLAVTAQSAAAQDFSRDPILFVHGHGLTASDWTAMRAFLETPRREATPLSSDDVDVTSDDVDVTSEDVAPGPRTSPPAQVRALESGTALPTAAGPPASSAAGWGKHFRRQKTLFADAGRTENTLERDSK